jgi:hypothetical protein
MSSLPRPTFSSQSVSNWACSLLIPICVDTQVYVAERIAFLKRLYEQWAAELDQLVGIEPERALHHAEALEDLANLIRELESTPRA